MTRLSFLRGQAGGKGFHILGPPNTPYGHWIIPPTEGTRQNGAILYSEALREEDTKRNLKHVKEPVTPQLCSAIALDDVQDRILTQPEPMTNLPIRLTFANKL
jgi:hypothetical protein